MICLVRRSSHLALVFLTVVAVSGNNAAENASHSDSLAYMEYRTRILHSDSAAAFSSYLDASDALAAEGLFSEALGVLQVLVSSERLRRETAVASARRTSHLRRISAGMDYYRLEDVDTVAMTADELERYRRLMETPLSVWTRSSARFIPNRGPIDEIVPEFYLSERKVRLDAGVGMALPGIRAFATGKAQKWLRGDSTDMGGAVLRMTPASDPDGMVSWKLPLSFDWEHYRYNRPGYESRRDYRFSPSLDIAFSRVAISTMVIGELRYQDYYGSAGIDTMDVLRLMSQVESTISGREKSVIRLRAGWNRDGYVQNPLLQYIDRYEAGLSSDHGFGNRITGRLESRLLNETEVYAPGEGIDFVLKGSEVMIRLSARITVKDWISLTPETGIEGRWADQKDTTGTGFKGRPYIWEARQAFEPGLRVGISMPVVDASIRSAFRVEDMDVAFEKFVSDNQLVRISMDLDFRIHGRLSMGSIVEYQYRTYAAGSVSENISASLNFSLRL